MAAGLVRYFNPAYLDEATDILGISKFYVVAHSLGSSYALACYDKLKHKIIGSVHILACWAHSNLPCMPVSYALQRSVPTGVLRRFIKYFTRASGALTFMPTQMGSVGYREKLIGQDVHVREILDCMQDEVSTEDYAAYELDWMVALEIRHPFAFSHRALKCAVKCWHGMDDDVCPLGVAMWMQREMSQFLLFAVEGATHNIHLDFSIVKALFADICAEAMTAKQALQPVVTKKSKKIPKEKKEDSVESESPDEEKREDFVETESPDATRVNSIDSQASHISGTTPVNGTNTLAPPKDLEGSAVWA